MKEIIVQLSISPDEYIKSYQLAGVNVSTRSVDGRVVQFPASILQGYVTREGVRGLFRICFNDQGKYQSIERC